MTKSKQVSKSKEVSKSAAPRPASGELSDAALSEASGGSLNFTMPAGSAGAINACDGSVRTNGILIGLLKQ